jgi:hypothetical protein
VPKVRSGSRIVHSELERKFWAKAPPSVDTARPARCACCDGAGREPGAPVAIVGHGVRDRQVRGPISADAAPTWGSVFVRRFRCRRCRAVMTVVPREVEPRRHYARSAIVLALARHGLFGESATEVRRAVCAWPITTATAGWSTLRRWIAAARRGVLVRSVAPCSGSAATVAARVAQIALGHAPPSVRGAPPLVLVFAGAVAMA